MQTDNNKGKKYTRIIAPIVGVCLLFALWHFVCSAGIFNSYVLPSPQAVGRAFQKMLLSGEIFTDIVISLTRVLRGFGIAFLAAFVLGSFYLLFPKLGQTYQYLIHFFRNVPPLSMIPLLILWCGIRETTKTVIIVLASFFPIYLNINKGFTGVSPQLLEVGRSYGFDKKKSFLRITLPSALSDVLVGMRVGLGYAWRAIIGAEMVAASTGLGHMILFAQQTSRTDKVIVGIFVIGVVGLLCDKIFGLIINLIFKGTAGNGWD